ncbi:MAG: hypothetical protein U1F81_12210 [Verrucomicrobiaceae bacterium]
MINRTVMSLIRRFALVALASASLTSCQTLGGLINSMPFRLLDEAGAEFVNLFSENSLPANGRPESIEDRAKKVEKEGLYAGQGQKPMLAPKSKMAAR